MRPKAFPFAQNRRLAELRRVPCAVLCLVSALEYHGIGTQIPAAVQIALPTGVKAPRIATVLRMKTQPSSRVRPSPPRVSTA